MKFDCVTILKNPSSIFSFPQVFVSPACGISSGLSVASLWHFLRSFCHQLVAFPQVFLSPACGISSGLSVTSLWHFLRSFCRQLVAFPQVFLSPACGISSSLSVTSLWHFLRSFCHQLVAFPEGYKTGMYPEFDAGGCSRGYSLFQAATPFLGVFNLQNIYFSLTPRGVTDTPNPLDTAL